MSSLIRLALPVVLGYLGIMAMHFVDLVFVGRVGASAVAAVGLGSSLFAAFMMFGLGVLSSLEYLVGHAEGTGEINAGRAALAQGFWWSALWGLVGMLGLILATQHLQSFGIDSAIIPETQRYLLTLAPSLPLVLGFTALRTYRQAKGDALSAMILMILANGVNALGNAVLVWGLWGGVQAGVVGSAWATNVSRVFLFAGLFGWVFWKEGRLPFRFEALLFRRMLVLGIPAGLQTTLEVGVFTLASGLAGRISAVAAAAHQLALNFASMTFMVPLGVGSAAAVLISRDLGAGKPEEASRVARRALGLGVGFMSCSAFLLLWKPDQILSLYTSDVETLREGIRILFIAGLFQVFDGVQVVLTGVLRGWGETRIAAWANGIGHWLIGLPLAVVLGAPARYALTGVWAGLCVGLICVALILAVRFRGLVRARVRGV